MKELNFAETVLGILLTFIIFIAYPFIRIVIMKKKYTQKELKKMLIWNSIILFIPDFIFCEINGINPSTTVIPPTLYYFINCAIWGVKSKSKRNNKSDSNNMFKCSECGNLVKESDKRCSKCGSLFEEEIGDKSYKCSNCGVLISETDTKCPKCGSYFEDISDDEIVYESDMDKKYSDLKKLKKLLDDKIITREEFNIEKKKILDR